MLRRRIATALAFVTLCWNVVVSGQPAPGEFEVREGYLSASVRQLVVSYGWSLVWEADEDRRIDFPFMVDNQSLEEALINILEGYRGQFVADLYMKNRVVVVDTPPPRVEVDLPGTQSQIIESDSTDLSANGELETDTVVAVSESQADEVLQVASTEASE